jgi:hypothetical protein
MVADELRRQADFFVELADLTDYIARAHAPRPAEQHDLDSEDDADDQDYDDEDDYEDDEEDEVDFVKD